MLRAVLIAAALLPSLAFAWPVDVTADLVAGKDEIRKLAALSWAEVEDPKVATVEVLPSGELLLTGKAPGRTLALLYAEGKFAVWRLRVSKAGEPVKAVDGAAELEAAKKACPGLTVREGTLSATIKDERCRKALLDLFQTDAFEARELELTFDLAALQAQLGAVEKGLAAAGVDGLSLHYSGAGVVLEGRADEAHHRTALWTLFKSSAGRVPVEDDIQSP